MADSFSSSPPLPLNTLVHHLSIKLTLMNYLICGNQVIPILTSHDMLSYVDDTSSPLAATITSEGKEVVNSAYSVWFAFDQKMLSLSSYHFRRKR
ncbi:hypothetical protein ACS0TY_016853 [Phlomoides rotata]